MDAWVLPLGVAAVALVVVQLGMMTIARARQVAFQKAHQRLALELMQQRIDGARKRREKSSLAWNGHRKFVIERKVDEADHICSYILAPHDRKPLPPFKPGQFLTFELNIPGREKPVIRCYSLSDAHTRENYRITVKRVLSPPDAPGVPPGLVSNYFHEQYKEGDILDVQAPRGHFVLDPDDERPTVLIAGGVGVTPLLCMAKTIAAAGSKREILFFYGVRDRVSHAFKNELELLSEQHANITYVACYSRPREQDKEGEGRDFHHTGRVTPELLKTYLQSTNYKFYICGPATMMKSLTTDLAKWGVAEKDIFTEAFGPATVSKAFNKPTALAAVAKAAAATCHVTFAKSGKQCDWTPESENLLDFASAHQVSIDSGCRAGSCGTCVVAIKSGNVSYPYAIDVDLEAGTCLTCVAVPDGDVVLDA